MKYTILMTVLLLTGCKDIFPLFGPHLDGRDINKVCKEAGGTTDIYDAHVGLVKGILTDSIIITAKCNIKKSS